MLPSIEGRPSRDVLRPARCSEGEAVPAVSEGPALTDTVGTAALNPCPTLSSYLHDGPRRSVVRECRPACCERLHLDLQHAASWQKCYSSTVSGTAVRDRCGLGSASGGMPPQGRVRIKTFV